jgi:hypothetical protein
VLAVVDQLKDARVLVKENRGVPKKQISLNNPEQIVGDDNH